MLRFLNRFSFTARLFFASVAIAVVLLTIDYVVMIRLPAQVAADSVEVALRENAQAFNTAIIEERQELEESLNTFVRDPQVAKAIRSEDTSRVEQLLSEQDFDDIHVAFIDRGELDGTGYGAVAVMRSIGLESKRAIVFYREITNEMLDRAAADSGDKVSFAVEREGDFVARSANYSRSLTPEITNLGADKSATNLIEVKIKGQRRHIFTRRLTQDSSYQVSTLSSRKLEEDAVFDARSDIRSALIAMTGATLIGLTLIILFTSRFVRRFAGRVRSLADGNYSERLQVHGSDGFADLAFSVNSLSSELEKKMSELKDSAYTFKRTLENLDEGICTWNSEGEITYWNRGAEQITAIQREHINHEDPVIVFLKAERAPGSRHVVLPARRGGSNGVVVDLNVTTLQDGNVLQTFRDTSMADALQQTQRDFMATAAHQLRTPITTILGFSDTLTNAGLDLSDTQRAEFLNIIHEQSHLLQDLAEAFFTNHQLANERVEVTLTPTKVMEAVTLATERAKSVMGELASNIDDVTIKVSDTLVVMADLRALTGVIFILLENALKYGSYPISITAESSGGTVALIVQDEGEGIESFHQARIFDPFYRIDVDMRSGVGGAGLGLFSARKLVEAMRGTINVRSVPGKGSAFIVELPIVIDEDAAGETIRNTGAFLR